LRYNLSLKFADTETLNSRLLMLFVEVYAKTSIFGTWTRFGGR